jgi:protein involved in polysaccharide export with SLBB domain
MRHRSPPAGLVGVLGLILAAGCRSPGPDTPRVPAPAVAPATPVEPERYVIQPGDQLEVRFFHLPDQNVLLPVRPDGFISLPLANEVQASGRTCEQLREELVERLRAELVDPEIAVIVRSFSAYRIHVGGHVKKGGMFDLVGKRTVLQAIFQAEGFLPTASPANVLLIRRVSENTCRAIPIDLTEVLSGEDMSQDIALQPYDAIYVASSAVADVNLWIDQYIRQNIPLNVGWRIEFGGKN